MVKMEKMGKSGKWHMGDSENGEILKMVENGKGGGWMEKNENVEEWWMVMMGMGDSEKTTKIDRNLGG